MQLAALFETNSASISSILVEFGTFDYSIAFPDFVIAEIPAKLHLKFFPFLTFDGPTCHYIILVIYYHHQWPEIFHRWPGFSSDGPPMAIDRILNNMLLTFASGHEL